MIVPFSPPTVGEVHKYSGNHVPIVVLNEQTGNGIMLAEIKP
jgi:hypothetical protein